MGVLYIPIRNRDRVYVGIKRIVSPPRTSWLPYCPLVHIYSFHVYREHGRSEVTKYSCNWIPGGSKRTRHLIKGQREKETWGRGTKEASRSAVTVSVSYRHSYIWTSDVVTRCGRHRLREIKILPPSRAVVSLDWRALTLNDLASINKRYTLIGNSEIYLEGARSCVNALENLRRDADIVLDF